MMPSASRIKALRALLNGAIFSAFLSSSSHDAWAQAHAPRPPVEPTPSKDEIAALHAEVKAPPLRTLSEVSGKLQHLDTQDGRQEAPTGASVTAASTPPKPLIVAQPPDEAGKMMLNMGLLPLEFTAFGDFYYRFARPASDDFHVGAVELDASLKLTPYVNVSTAIVYSGDADAFGIGAFVIDCGLAGDGDGYPIKSKRLSKSGVSFGRFDVPFGIAYLQYAATENRLLTLPQAVELTHAAWNDVGFQGYAIGEHWTAVAYLVNGMDHPIGPGSSAPSRAATGTRLSTKVDDWFELGASGALHFVAEGPVMLLAGGDVQTTLGPLDVRCEYLLKQVKAEGLPELTHGAYGQALLKLDPAFFLGRYDAVFADSETLDRRVAGGVGVEIFPQGEVRAVYEQSLDRDLRTVTVQLVGGSSFRPTGLRR
jgi:hypothetical protein